MSREDASSDAPLEAEFVVVGIAEEELLHAKWADHRAFDCETCGLEVLGEGIEVLAADVKLCVAVDSDSDGIEMRWAVAAFEHRVEQ